MEIYQAIILGVIQGLTELLPVSSSAHLFIIPWMFNWSEIPESFDVALHFGTLLAIGLFFFKDWISLLKGGYKLVFKKEKNFEGNMLIYLIIATIPAVIGALLFKELIDTYLKTPLIVAICLMIMGVILYFVDKKCKSKTTYEELSLKQTVLIGASQILAFIPGVSRSGITMTVGRILGVTREATAKYSFMLSAPIVLGATIFDLKDFIEFLTVANTTGIIAFVLGILMSFIVGIIVIKFLLEYLKKGSFKIFSIYRILFGLLIIGTIIIK